MAEKKVKPVKNIQKKKQLGSKTQKAKKKWFTVLAPESFHKKEIGEIPANEPNLLLGRTINVTFGEISGNKRDVFNKVLLKINKVRGETAETEVKKLFVAESYIQTMHRRKKHRILSVFNAKTKDEKELKLKIYTLCKENVHRSVSSKINAKTIELTQELIKKSTADEILNPDLLRKICGMLKENLKVIYPCTPIVWKIYNLSA